MLLITNEIINDKNTKSNIVKWAKNKSQLESFKYQILDLSVYGRHLIGFRSVFNEYLEDLEIYTSKTQDVQEYSIR